ncbi:hypothetical protein ACM66B_005819 [Microbotryomycetes sp. NB124-2]
MSASNSTASSLDTPGYYAALATPPSVSQPSTATPTADSIATQDQGKRQLRDIEELLPMPKKSKQSPEPVVSASVSPPPIPASPSDVEDDQAVQDDKPSTPFISKLVYLLSHDEYKDYVQWDSTGKYIILAHNCPRTLEMLTKFFRHTTTASFVRQLNIYGFKRLSTTDLLATLELSLSPQSFATSDYCAFYNSEFFKPSRGRPCLTSKLKPAHKERARSKKKTVKKDSDDSASP